MNGSTIKEPVNNNTEHKPKIRLEQHPFFSIVQTHLQIFYEIVSTMTTQSDSIGSRVIRGTFWTVGMRWISRLMGLGSMLVIARLLTPEDFGIIGVATAIVGLMETFTDLGVDTALIYHPNPQRKQYDTAWTYSILIHLFSAALIAVSGFFSAHFYNDPRYESVLYVMSISMLINGFTNMGFTEFRRNLAFQKDFQINVSIQLVGIFSTIGFGFWLHSYWALVFGTLARSIVRLFLTYIMHPYRPRLSLAASNEMFSFSFWMMVRSIALFLTTKADRLILAAYFSPAILGLYAIAGELTSMAVYELLNPLSRVLLPALATKQNDQLWLEENIKKIFNVTATIAMATGAGIAAIAEPVLALIYGTQYVQAAPMMMLLAILNIIGGFNQPVGQILLLMKKTRDFAIIFILEGIATVLVVYSLSTNHFDFQTILYGRLCVTSLTFIRLFYLLRSFKSIGFFAVLSAWIRPVTAGLIMYYTLHYFQQITPELHPEFTVLFSIVIGAITFTAVLLALWYLMRKPMGIEYEFISRYKKK